MLLFLVYKVLDQLGGYLPPGSIGPSDLTSLFLNILKVSGAPLFDVYVTQDLLRKPYAAIFIDLPKDIKFIADIQEVNKLLKIIFYYSLGS